MDKEYHVYCGLGGHKTSVTHGEKLISEKYLNGLVGETVPLVYIDTENDGKESVIGSATFCKSNEDDFVYMDATITDEDVERVLRSNGSVGLKNISISTQISVEIGEN